VCAENESEQEHPCECDAFNGELPPGVFVPTEHEKNGCHEDVGSLALEYALPDCARTAELSGHVSHYKRFTGDCGGDFCDSGDDDTLVDLCPDVETMRVDPFVGGPMELRTQGSFLRDPRGALHIEVQDCRWYDGVFTIDDEALGVGPFEGDFVFSSRPASPSQHEMFSAAGDWVADFLHNETPPEEAHAEIHEARAIAVVRPATELVSVALPNAFFGEGTRQQEHIHLGIKVPPPSGVDPSVFNKLTCFVLGSGFSVDPPCGSVPGIRFQVIPDPPNGGDRCNLELDRNGAVEPLPFDCTDTCDNKRYIDDPETFCENVHFMNPVVAEWKDPGDLWVCESCGCADLSSPGDTITAPVQGCAPMGLDPMNAEHQAIACAEVCGGTFCGGSPACAIGECQPPPAGGTAYLVARGACDPFAPEPFVRVAAAGDYHVVIRPTDDENGPGSTVVYTVGDESAAAPAGGSFHVNVGADGQLGVIDFAQTWIEPADVTIAGLALTGTLVTTADRPFGQFVNDTAFHVPASVGVPVARALINGVESVESLVNPSASTGTFDLSARTFSLTIQASSDYSQLGVSATLNGVIDNVPPVANSGGPVRDVECASHSTTAVLLQSAGSFDPDPGDAISHYQWFTSLGGPVGNDPNELVHLPFGKSFFALHVYDQDLSAASAPLEVDVVDTTPPELVVSPKSFCLGPPNHKRVRFHLGTDVAVNTYDTCDPNPTVSIIAVSSDEPDDGLGDGDTAGDATFGPRDFCVRRERAALGGGRTYTVTIEARDFAGNTTMREIKVFVPHDQSGGSCEGTKAGTVIEDGVPCDSGEP
jgi:hypothetical protein